MIDIAAADDASRAYSNDDSHSSTYTSCTTSVVKTKQYKIKIKFYKYNKGASGGHLGDRESTGYQHARILFMCTGIDIHAHIIQLYSYHVIS